MNKEDFLSIAEPHMIEAFETPILNNEPIWTMLNVKNDLYIYGHTRLGDLVIPIVQESLSEWLSSGELNTMFNVIYLLGEEVDVKEEECQRPSEKSDITSENTIIVPSAPPVEEDNFDYSVGSTPTPTKTVWDLEMHEEMFLQAKYIDEHTEGYRYDVMRVPGGWLYTTDEKVTTFVPYEAQKFNTGCVLCGNTIDKTANIILQVLNKLNDETYTYTDDKALLGFVKEYLLKQNKL